MAWKNTIYIRPMAMRIDKVYTRSGDDGTTALIGGRRVSKDHPRVEAYGCVDELNAALGLCRSTLASDPKLGKKIQEYFDSALREIQNRLFDLGSVLAVPDGKMRKGMPLPGPDTVKGLEKSMDAMQKGLQPLNSFVLPGGSAANAWLHQCRVLCRRAERRVIALRRQESVPPEAVRYLNRLSDWCFVAARYVAKKSAAPETLWEFPLRATSNAKVKPARPRPVP